MIKISRTVSYALQATIQLAQSDSKTPVPCSRLAAKGSMPERFLLQILRSLVTHGILQSTRGVEGGYSLIRAPEDVSILEVIEAIDGPLNFLVTDEFQGEAQPKLAAALNHVTQSARNQLESIKLANIIDQPRPTNMIANNLS